MIYLINICVYCSQLFGEEDPDEDVSPDTADPEAAGNINNFFNSNILELIHRYSHCILYICIFIIIVNV